MFVRTGATEEQLAVVITDPRPTQYDCIACIAIQSVLDLRHKPDAILCEPENDFRSGYDAGLIDITPAQRQKLIRWTDAGYTITIYATAAGEWRFGRVPAAKLALNEADRCFLDAWLASMDLAAEKRNAVQQAAEVVKQPVKKARPKLKAKERRKRERNYDN